MATFTLRSWRRYLPRIARRIEDAAVRGMRSAALRAKIEVIREIDTASPYPAVNTGGLRQSVQVINLPNGAEVVVDAPHAPFLEEGTRPFWPPLEPLVAWVIRKGLAPSLGDPDEQERFAIQVARAIQYAIASRGIEPRHFLAKAMVRMPAIVQAEVGRELAAVRG